jgi:hypothetical protein
MVSVKRILLSFTLLMLAPISSRSRPATDQLETSHTSLFAQGAAQTLNQNFPDPDVSFLVVDVRSGELLVSRWDRPDVPIQWDPSQNRSPHSPTVVIMTFTILFTPVAERKPAAGALADTVT